MFKVALRFKFINEKGIIFNINSKFSITHKKKNNIRNCHDEPINLMSLFNLTKNNKEIEIVKYKIKYRWKWVIFPGLNKENKIYLDYLLKKLINNTYDNFFKLLIIINNLKDI